MGDVTNKGSYTGSASPYGTFDQGGNVWEWNEAIGSGLFVGTRGRRGGSYSFGDPVALAAANRVFTNPTGEVGTIGFRVASIPGAIPEPGTGLLVIAGLLGLAGWRRARA